MRQVTVEEQDLLLAILAENYQSIFAKEGVIHADVGFRIKEGRHTDELAIRVHVKQKLPDSFLQDSERLPKKLMEAGVDVVQSSRQLHGQPRTGRFDPVMGGIQTGSRRWPSNIGTLGLVVRQIETGDLLGLTNHHIWVRSLGSVDDKIYQPQTLASADSIGTLVAWNQSLDCAIARLNMTRIFRLGSVLDVPLSVNAISLPLVGMPVVKSGMTTRVTFGLVDGVGLPGTDLTIVTDPSFPPNHGEISLPGDSGSVWLSTSTGAAIGLHYAGEEAGDPMERAWAKRMTDVSAALKFTVT